jgi:hypothetical protein
MSDALINSHPAEALEISPEALEIANCFLVIQDPLKVADELDMPREMVMKILSRREVKAYIDNVFFNYGFNNRFKMRKALDSLISKKFQELDESDTGSNKDIADLLSLSHKFTMDEYDKMIELLKLQQAAVKTQTNIQINDTGGGSNYTNLLKQLLTPDS